MLLGKLDRKVTIQSKTESRDEYGQEVASYSTFGSVWANRRSRPADEFFEAGRVVSEQLYYYTIRYIDGIGFTMRLVDGSEVFDIVEIRIGDKRKQYLQLTCRLVK